ncbi:MAG: thermonuclease family protein [Actinomycetota bacterium]
MRGCRAVAVGLVALLAAGCSPGSREAGVQQGPYPVVRTVDGDTIRVVREGQEIVVRLIGINTPETVAPDRPVECFGPEASERTKQLVTGQKVWLEYDEVTGETDKYDRTLAYVWLTPDQMLNEELVREGYAEERTYEDGYRYQDRLRDAEEAAQGAGAGLWSACP